MKYLVKNKEIKNFLKDAFIFTLRDIRGFRNVENGFTVETEESPETFRRLLQLASVLKHRVETGGTVYPKDQTDLYRMALIHCHVTSRILLDTTEDEKFEVLND